MKKRYIALYLLMVFVLSACGVDRTKDVVGVSDALGGTEAESITEEFSVSETMMDDEDSEELQIMEVNKCVHFLHKNGKALVDADKDGLADTFRIDYVDREGGLYIEEFEFALGGGGSFRILESELPYTFNGHIEYIDSFDFNEDGKEELLVMFDTHGAGGQGTHELYVLWLEEDGSIISDGPITHVEMLDTVRPNLSEAARIDTIYQIQKVKRGDKVCLQIRQYVWENFHTDSIGDLVSIVSLEKGSNTLVAEDAWMTSENMVW